MYESSADRRVAGRAAASAIGLLATLACQSPEPEVANDGAAAAPGVARPGPADAAPDAAGPGREMTVPDPPSAQPRTGDAAVSPRRFGEMPDGRPVREFTLDGGAGVTVRVIEYGAIITSITAPDRNGAPADVVLGFDELAGYLADPPYFGAVVGRYANRIAGGRFTLDGREYELATNNGPNHLHGGDVGFDKRLWRAAVVETNRGRLALRLEYASPAGEEGYPGTLRAAVTYTLSGTTLAIEYEATTDAATVVNLTQHSYFNLAGAGDILGHRLAINGRRITPVDETLIPTGQLALVDDTPFDLIGGTIGDRIDDDHPQLIHGGGYDHNFVLSGPETTLRQAAVLVDPRSGRALEILTTEPGLQFYSGNFLDGTIVGKGGRVYGHRSGLCLETQHFPDSPNQRAFPSTVLRPGDTYRSRTLWRFYVADGVEGGIP